MSDYLAQADSSPSQTADAANAASSAAETTDTPASPEELILSMDDAFAILVEELKTWIETAIASIPNFIVAVLALIAAYIIGSLVARGSESVFRRMFNSPPLTNLFSTIVKVLVVALGFFIALDMIGLQKAVVSLLAGAGIIGLAIGFAFQDLAENFLAGLMLAVRKPFAVGEIIETNGFMGTVQELNLRNTIIKDFDGQCIYIPNKEVFKNPLENYAESHQRRITVRVGVSYGEDLEHVRSVLQRALKSLDFLEEGQNSDAWAMEFGDSSINFDVRYWIRFPDGDVGYLDAIHRGVSAIKREFDEEGITIPFPIRTLDFGIKGGEKLDSQLREADLASAS